MASPEIVTYAFPIIADGEHKVIALTSAGRMFERIADPRNFNTRNGSRIYLWREFSGPLDTPAVAAV